MSRVADCESRLQKLKSIRMQRASLPITSPERMKESCDLIPNVIDENHGYHRDCYQRFTKNLDRLQSTSSAEPENMKRVARAKHSTISIRTAYFATKKGVSTLNVKDCGLKKTHQSLSMGVAQA